LSEHVPTGVIGFLLAGLGGSVHVEFCRHPQRGAGLCGERYLQALHQPNAGGKKEVALSRLVSLVFLVIGIVFGLLTNRSRM